MAFKKSRKRNISAVNKHLRKPRLDLQAVRRENSGRDASADMVVFDDMPIREGTTKNGGCAVDGSVSSISPK